MATPNYSYEKRQRELAKKRKAEEKRQKKMNKSGDAPSDDGVADGEPADDTESVGSAQQSSTQPGAA